MKKFLMSVCALLLTLNINAQVKNYVGIIRENKSASYTNFLNNLKEDFKNRGYYSYANYIESYLSGSFGTGFIYVDDSGSNYVITNRHVVSQAETASIEFENADGSITKFDKLYVLITDDDIDLAILKFEDNKTPFKEGLTFFKGNIKDGQDVISAGFPGLAGEPIWQFGKGSITNANARIKTLIDPNISSVIQHSAQIDAGNSGGPLLVNSKESNIGYEVIGVNTWKALGRDSTNFSIPIALVIKLIEQSKSLNDEQEQLSKRELNFYKALNNSENDFTSIVKYVSYNLAIEKGPDCFENIIKHASTNIKNLISEEFINNPIEGLRYAVAYNIFQNYSGENTNLEKLSEIEWKKEHGVFRIFSDGNYEKIKKTNKERPHNTSTQSHKKQNFPSVNWIEFSPPYKLSINSGISIPIKEDNSLLDLNNSFNIGVNFFFGDLGILGFFFDFEHGNVSSTKFDAFGGGLTMRLPLNFDLFCISPIFSCGINFSKSNTKVIQEYVEILIETTFNLGIQLIRPGFCIGYTYVDNSFSSINNYKETIKLHNTGLLIRLVLGFQF